MSAYAIIAKQNEYGTCSYNICCFLRKVFNMGDNYLGNWNFKYEWRLRIQKKC